MSTPNLETILASRPQVAVGPAQRSCTPDIERVNTPREKAAVLARLTLQLAELDYERRQDGHA